jgi:hypothetical protein
MFCSVYTFDQLDRIDDEKCMQHAVARARLRLNSHSDIEETEIYSDEPLSSSSVSPLTHHLNPSAKTAHETKPDRHLSDEELEKLAHDFTPFIFHQPFPTALVNRLPGHETWPYSTILEFS